MIAPNILKCMTPEQRKQFGKDGMTAEEGFAKCEEKREKDIHKNIAQLLSRRGILPIHSRMDKRSTATPGAVDFAFCYYGEFVAWEAKTPGKDLEPEQVAFRDNLLRNGCRWYAVVFGVEDAIRNLTAMDAFFKRKGTA